MSRYSNQTKGIIFSFCVLALERIQVKLSDVRFILSSSIPQFTISRNICCFLISRFTLVKIHLLSQAQIQWFFPVKLRDCVLFFFFHFTEIDTPSPKRERERETEKPTPFTPPKAILFLFLSKDEILNAPTKQNNKQLFVSAFCFILEILNRHWI